MTVSNGYFEENYLIIYLNIDSTYFKLKCYNNQNIYNKKYIKI